MSASHSKTKRKRQDDLLEGKDGDVARQTKRGRRRKQIIIAQLDEGETDKHQLAPDAQKKKKKFRRPGKSKKHARDRVRNASEEPATSSPLPSQHVNGHLLPDSSASLAATSWKTSQTLGGRLIKGDVTLTEDERYLILGYRTAINVYSMENSSLIRSIPVTSSTSADVSLTAYALSRADDSKIYAATSQGIFYLFDRSNGLKLGRWKLGGTVRDLDVSVLDHAGTLVDVVYTREQIGAKWSLSAHILRSEADALKTESKTVLSFSNSISHFKILREGEIVIAASDQRLLVGVSTATLAGSLKDLKYVWREVVTPEKITCIDVRLAAEESMRPQSKRRSSSKQKDQPEDFVDVVTGHADGILLLHADIVRHLVHQVPRNGLEATPPAPRKLHWHRKGVHCVKWSRDGNYLISGGSETVLVLWQLETDRKQFIPHLMASIDSVVVSPSGTSYAIRLSDNSVIVLSTSELKPKAYVGGIQAEVLCPIKGLEVVNHAKNNTGLREGASVSVRGPLLPAAISRLNSTQLLLAVPAVSASEVPDDSPAGAPYLQAVDIATAHHASRQALARTIATDLNIGPEMNQLKEPSVTFMRTSHDGKWLATVDEWSLPTQDLEGQSLGIDDTVRQQNRRCEIHLKFWSWKAESQQWELVTRIDRPHTFGNSTQAAGVLDLQSSPSEVLFATFGQDFAIRIWQGKSRVRNGMVLRGDNGEPLVGWRCRHVIPLGNATTMLDHPRSDRSVSGDRSVVARLAFSADGTALAAAYSGPDDDSLGQVFFIDTDSGEIRRVERGLHSGAITGLGFIERYLITVSDDLQVWDVVEARRQYGFSLQQPDVTLSRVQRAALTLLSVDVEHDTFALALPLRRASNTLMRQRTCDGESLSPTLLRDTHSEIVIFDPRQPLPLHSVKLPYLVTALVTIPGATPTYVVVDGRAEMRVICGPPPSALGRVTAETADAAAGNDGNLAAQSPRPLQSANGIDANSDNPTEIFQPATYLDNLNLTQTKARAVPNVTEDAEADANEEDEDDDEDNHPPVIRQEQLTQIFDIGPAYALPPVRELFASVAQLLSAKKSLVASGA